MWTIYSDRDKTCLISPSVAETVHVLRCPVVQQGLHGLEVDLPRPRDQLCARLLLSRRVLWLWQAGVCPLSHGQRKLYNMKIRQSVSAILLLFPAPHLRPRVPDRDPVPPVPGPGPDPAGLCRRQRHPSSLHRLHAGNVSV